MSFYLTEEKLARMLVEGSKISIKRNYLIALTQEEAPDSFTTYKPVKILSCDFYPTDLFKFNDKIDKYRKIHIIPLKKQISEKTMTIATRDYGVFTTTKKPYLPIEWVTVISNKNLYGVAEQIKQKHQIKEVIFHPAGDITKWSHLKIWFVLLLASSLTSKEKMREITKKIGLSFEF